MSISIIIFTLIPLVLIFFVFKDNKKTYGRKIEGETIKIDNATVEESNVTTAQGAAQLVISVRYVVENREYINQIFKKIDFMGLECFKKGKVITILLDKADHNNILIDPKWLYESGAMLKSEYLMRKRKNLL